MMSSLTSEFQNHSLIFKKYCTVVLGVFQLETFRAHGGCHKIKMLIVIVQISIHGQKLIAVNDIQVILIVIVLNPI